MGKETTLLNWIGNMEEQLMTSSLYNLDYNSEYLIKLIEDDVINLFNEIMLGHNFKFINFKNGDAISVQIANFKRSDKYTKKELFTNQAKEKQLEILNNIYNDDLSSWSTQATHHIFLCFGILKYTFDLSLGNRNYMEAPLILLPVRLIKINEKEFHLEGVKNEIVLNEALIDKIKKERKIDLSYPLDSAFSLSEYLYYVGVKIKNLNWSISNTSLLTLLDDSFYRNYTCIKKNITSLSEKDLIKKISYLNSEFYHFSNKNVTPFDGKYLSILEMDNDEYFVLKKVANKEKMFLRTYNDDSKYHIASNIILSYLLNNQKILVVYSSNEQKENILKQVASQGYEKFVLLLDEYALNKEKMLDGMLSYNQYDIAFNSVKNNLILENVESYYAVKNKFKGILNALRTNKNRMGASINKLINEYYKLNQYPLLDVKIKDASKYTPDTLSNVLGSIQNLSKALDNLNCEVKDHAFYGFNKTTMRKEDYLPLREISLELSVSLVDLNTLLSYGNQMFSYPKVNTLKQTKALLNLMSFKASYKGDKELLNVDNLLDNYYLLREKEKESNELKNIYDHLVDKYTRQVKYITPEMIYSYYAKQDKKIKNKIKKILGNHIENNHLENIIVILKDYYDRVYVLNDDLKQIPEILTSYLKENRLDELETNVKAIINYRKNVTYIQKTIPFDDKTLFASDNNYELLMHRRSLQTLFNEVLRKTNIFQSYFDQKIMNFTILDFATYINKINEISQSFSIINDYTKYYMALHNVNQIIPKLGDDLVAKAHQFDFKNVFLKRFYYDYVTQVMHNNPTFKNYSHEEINKILNEFTSSDEKRKKMINDVISSYISDYLSSNIANLRKQEIEPFMQMIGKNKKNVPLAYITNALKKTIVGFKPCIMASFSNVSKYLNDDTYQFDGILYLPNENTSIIDALPSLYKGQHFMIMDDKYIDNNVVSSKLSEKISSNSLIKIAKDAYEEVIYKADKKITPLEGNFIDTNFKHFLAEKLKLRGVEVILNKSIQGHTIDLVCRIPNTRNNIALIIDHLSYNSPENASSNFIQEENTLNSLSYIPYRIFPSTFFYHEEKEMQDLITFIVSNSQLIPTRNKNTKVMLLMDYLFPLYVDPKIIYYSLDKENMTLENIILSLINQCAPISNDELELVIKENTRDVVSTLAAENKIIIDHGFIYQKDQKVVFRRVDRSLSYYRPAELVSEKEFYHAIYTIIEHLGQIEKDKVIKMIILSLGYKKLNKDLYLYIDSKINDLINKSVIFFDNNLLYKEPLKENVK